MNNQLGICDICEKPVLENDDPIKGGYIRVCGVYAHAICAENYGKDADADVRGNDCDGRV